MISAVGYLFGAAMLARLGWEHGSKSCWYAAIIILAMALRELDFHSQFTTMGIFKSKFYVSPKVPLLEKCIGGAITLSLAWVSLKYIRTHFKTWRLALKNKQSWSVGVGAAIVFAVLSKTIDRNSDFLKWLVEPVHYYPWLYVSSLEEVLELAIPAFLLFAIYRYREMMKW